MEQITNDKPVLVHEVQPLTKPMLKRIVSEGLTLEDFLTNQCTTLSGVVGGPYTIYETKAKEPIHLLETNRMILEVHVQALMKSYEDDGYYFTILNLNEKLEQIDGQHRFESAMRKGLPVRFMIMPGWGIKEVTVLNVNSRNWRLIDFLESYAKQGNPNYLRFKEFYEGYEFDIPTCQLILTGRRSRGTSPQDSFKSGQLQIDDAMIVTGTKKAKQIGVLKKFHPLGWKSRNCVEAMLILFNTLDYDHDHLIEKLERYPEMTLMKAGSLRTEEYLRLFVEKFNHRRLKGKIEVTSLIR